MSQEVLNYVIEKTRELIAAPTCSSEQKQQRRSGWMQLGRMQKKKKLKNILQNWKPILCQLIC